MKLAIIGASGFVGSHLLQEALQRGHKVTAIVRNPAKITTHHPHLTVKACDVMDAAALAPLLAGNDAVISAYNSGWTNPNIYDDFMRGSDAILRATREAGVPRLLVVGGAGSLEIAPGKQLVDTPEFPEAYKAGATAARDFLDQLKREQSLDWTLLSPAIEMNPTVKTGRTGKYRTGTDQPVFDNSKRSFISVEDLCVALMDETEKPQFPRKRFTVGY
ncbi:NAD(P)-dependent oxidoreductase [Pseudoflavitalea sp. G-6-1-2]|uniref:NAD(P)-dependent oxidoreductase n=1 Tax=Pseudoflavitalea sp. G-6-1-2 TaxID=2728841 RepID=UPI001982469F|nr:NAD(P)-dependent oxidoreductase [Pseudoflavitalea sp. G-6-1-2]